jgi:hypothetical protein
VKYKKDKLKLRSGIRCGDIDNSKEWSWFRVLIKNEQVNDNVLNLKNYCENKTTLKVIGGMIWYEMTMK